MTEKKARTDFSGYLQIDMQEIQQVEYWLHHWKITKEQLLRAVKAVDSTIVSEIEDYIVREGWQKPVE